MAGREYYACVSLVIRYWCQHHWSTKKDWLDKYYRLKCDCAFAHLTLGRTMAWHCWISGLQRNKQLWNVKSCEKRCEWLWIMNPYESVNLVLRVLSCVLVWYPASIVARFRDYLIWDLASNLVAELHLWFCCHWVSLTYRSSAIGFAGCLIGSCFGVPAQAYLGSQLLGSIPQEVALGNWMLGLLWMRRYYMQLCKACPVRQKDAEDFWHINTVYIIYIYICLWYADIKGFLHCHQWQQHHPGAFGSKSICLHFSLVGDPLCMKWVKCMLWTCRNARCLPAQQ